MEKKSVSNSPRVKITRDLIVKALVWHCPRYTRQGSKGEPSHSCSNFDGTFTNCPGTVGLCSLVGDFFKTMVQIRNGEIDV